MPSQHGQVLRCRTIWYFLLSFKEEIFICFTCMHLWECMWGHIWWSEHNLLVLVLSCHHGISWDGTLVLRLGCRLLHLENHLASPISCLFLQGCLSYEIRPLSVRPHDLFLTSVDISSLIESYRGGVSCQSGFTRGKEPIGWIYTKGGFIRVAYRLSSHSPTTLSPDRKSENLVVVQ